MDMKEERAKSLVILAFNVVMVLVAVLALLCSALFVYFFNGLLLTIVAVVFGVSWGILSVNRVF